MRSVIELHNKVLVLVSALKAVNGQNKTTRGMRNNAWISKCSQEDPTRESQDDRLIHFKPKRCFVRRQSTRGSDERHEERRDSRGKDTLTKTEPTLHSEDSWRPLTACITGIFSRVSALQFIDDKLDYSPFLFQVVLAAGCQLSVTMPPGNNCTGFIGLTAKNSDLPCLSFNLLQLSFEKDRLGCRGGK